MDARILVLEDDLGLANLYAEALERAGHHPAVFLRFEDARQALRDHLPDAVLTDVRVGEYNGLQLALLFRSLSPNGKILIVSGHDDPVIRDEVERIPAVFLPKPIDLHTLLRFFE